MLHWLAREQMESGAWTYRVRLLLRYHLHDNEVPPDQFESRWPPSVSDTAIAGLAFLRAGQKVDRGTYGKNVRHAADYLYNAVNKSDEKSLTIANPTNLTFRIGPQIDSFSALLFFSELREPGGTPNASYELAIQKLVTKISRNQKPDGSWDDDKAGGMNAPLLGHAFAVWALESAVRHDVKIDPTVVTAAEQYALSKDAEKREWKRNGKWKKESYGRPDYILKGGVCDDEPVNFESYFNAARLSVMYQSDLTKRWSLGRDLQELKRGNKSPTDDELVSLRDKAAAAKASRQSLERARDDIRKTWGNVPKDARNSSPAPVFFTGEDFLACLLVVDSMAECKDVETWFQPVVQRLMYFQDMDGGLRTDQPIFCEHRTKSASSTTPFMDMGIFGVVLCEPPFSPWPEDDDSSVSLRPHKRNSKDDPAPVVKNCFVSPQFCMKEWTWCSKDRLTITAAGLMTLLADTPYRPAVLGIDKQVLTAPDKE